MVKLSNAALAYPLGIVARWHKYIFLAINPQRNVAVMNWQCSLYLSPHSKQPFTWKWLSCHRNRLSFNIPDGGRFVCRRVTSNFKGTICYPNVSKMVANIPKNSLASSKVKKKYYAKLTSC